ncbi:NAD-binding domain 4 protein [Penicillium antarcticum]|uniref:NAD-binding domain 4 protein n=1 Tax=Penicillium antarcticum TaxID=416450 RepID=UPI0023932581|nr:NAD-binding domain 4 protein [Penicillium antarcticum]KAJ5295644.1 NAD-binding domain 4 protein [Penicillium antarcticum]
MTLGPALEVFKNHTVLLTGSTGALGACLLYKLAVQLPTKKIYVLIRSTPDVALQKWRDLMPDQMESIILSQKLHYIRGDISQPSFGLDNLSMEKLCRDVTLIVNAAADISFASNILEAVRANCLPALELARLASEFSSLKLFVQISTAYVNSFLPDGEVEEKIYEVSDNDPEDVLSSILDSGNSSDTARFFSSYSHAKYLMERLLLERYPTLPLMLLRPTCFGPALRDPYRLYGPDSSLPLNEFGKAFIAMRDPAQIFHATEGSQSGTNVLDEIPVDFIANACLLHAANETYGIVHVGCELYVSRTFDDFIDLYRLVVPPEKQASGVVFVQSRNQDQCFLADLVRVGTRNWRFDCSRSKWISGVYGPLSLHFSGEDAEDLRTERMRKIFRKVDF